MLVLLATAAAGAAPGDARLEEGAPQLAEQRYRIARALYAKGQLEEAAKEFEAAFDIYPESAKLAFNVGRVCERLDRVEDAVAAYERYLELAQDAQDHEAVRRLVTSLRARLKDRLGALLVTTAPEGAAVYLDDAATPAGHTPVTLDVEPGAHAVRLSREGFQVALRTVEIKGGERSAVAVELRAVEAAPAAAEGPGWRPVAGWVAVGLGAAGLGLGVWAHLDGLEQQALAGRRRAGGGGGAAARGAGVELVRIRLLALVVPVWGCLEHVEVEPCVDDSQCPGRRCVMGACVAGAPDAAHTPDDEGVDPDAARASDGATPDGATVDASSDGAAVDATRDGPRPDAPTPDGAQADALPDDATAPDVRSADARVCLEGPDDDCDGVDDDCDDLADEDGDCLSEGFVLMPPGTFWMGSPPEEPGRDPGDETRHRVRLTRPFLVKRTEVTQAEWRAVFGNNPSTHQVCGDDCPVETINFYEAASWCNARSRQEGLEPCYELQNCNRNPPRGGAQLRARGVRRARLHGLPDPDRGGVGVRCARRRARPHLPVGERSAHLRPRHLQRHGRGADGLPAEPQLAGLLDPGRERAPGALRRRRERA